MYEEEKTESDFLNRNKKNPFTTPDQYFDSLEDRIMGGIKHSAKTKSPSAKIIQFVKPVLGLVASFTLVYMLVYYPINNFLLKNNAGIATSVNVTSDPLDGYSLSFSLVDENSLVNTIFSDESSTQADINPDDVLAYLATGSNDLEIYSEIQSKNPANEAQQ